MDNKELYLVTFMGKFYPKFMDYIDKEDQYKIEYEEGRWINQESKKYATMIEMIKKYFNVKSGFKPFKIPQCTANIIVLVSSGDKSDLENVVNSLKFGINEYEYRDKESVVEYLNAITM
jgi:hypothetical protein